MDLTHHWISILTSFCNVKRVTTKSIFNSARLLRCIWNIGAFRTNIQASMFKHPKITSHVYSSPHDARRLRATPAMTLRPESYTWFAAIIKVNMLNWFWSCCSLYNSMERISSGRAALQDWGSYAKMFFYASEGRFCACPCSPRCCDVVWFQKALSGWG